MRILLADDHALVLEGFRSSITRLEPATEIVTASNFADAFRIAKADPNFSVILLDLNMPGMTDLEGLRLAVATFPDTSVAIMTGMIQKSVATEVLAAGAKGFIPKTIGAERLADALKELAAGNVFLPEDLLADAVSDETFDFGIDSLTARERHVAAILVKGYSNKEIARALNVREVTVKLHVRNMCRKLDTRNRTQIAVRLLQSGQFG